MSSENGSRIPTGAVILGGRQRTVTLSRDNESLLTIMARMNRISNNQMLDHIVEVGIQKGWQETMAGKLFAVLARWPSWARWS